MSQFVEIDTIHGLFSAIQKDLITDHLIEFGAHTRNELMMVLDHIKADDIVLDLGSHIGTFGIPIAKKLSRGNGHIYCIEANSETYSLLKKNVILNSLNSCVTPIRALISQDNQSEYKTIRRIGNSGASHYLKCVNEIESDHDVKTLRSILAKYSINRIDFIKLDVEGMEYEILKSIKEELKEFHPILYIEISRDQLGRYNNTPEQIESLLLKLGYKFYMNSYKRNSKEDYYAKSEIMSLRTRPFFDVLAIPKIT